MDTATLTHQDIEVERATIGFPIELWKRARHFGIDLGVPAGQLVVEGLELRLAQLEKKKAIK